MDIEPVLTWGNFIGPFSAAASVLVAIYFQNKSAKQTDASTDEKRLQKAIEPLRNDITDLEKDIVELRTRTADFVPKADIDARFRAEEAGRLAMGLDLTTMRESMTDIRVQQGKVEQQISGVNVSIDKLESGQRDILTKLDQLLLRGIRPEASK